MYVNMVLEDVTEYELTPEGKKVCAWSGRADACLWEGARFGRGVSAALLNLCAPQKRRACPPTHVLPLRLPGARAQVTHLDQILLNGNNVAVLVPGGKPEDGQ